MSKDSKITIVILSYNTEGLLRDCLNSIEKSKGANSFSIVVVDNGSTDGSKDMVKKEFLKVEWVGNKNNLGFSAGNNVALNKVKSEYALLLNPDTLVEKESISRVYEYMVRHPEVGAATCKVELSDNKLDYSCHRGFPTPWNAFTYFTGLAKLFPKSKTLSGYTQTYKNMDTTHEIDALTGAFALIRTEAGKEVGWLDEDYFWNGEDIDFCFKLKEKGWKIVYIPDVKIMHFKGSSSGLKKSAITKPPKSVRKKAAQSSTQAMHLFYKKNLSSEYPKIVDWLVSAGITSLEFFRVTKNTL